MNLDEIGKLRQRFEVDEKCGFLLENPVCVLPQKYLPWHQIAGNVPELIRTKTIEVEVSNLPLIDIDEIKTYKEFRLSHLLLTTIASGYVWANGLENPKISLPSQIALPLCQVSEMVGLKPIVCHASACLANYQHNSNQQFTAENMRMIAAKFIETVDNDNFFLYTAQVEYELAAGHNSILIDCFNLRLSDTTFSVIRDSLSTATKTLWKLRDNVSPDVFYNQMRVYISGYAQGAFCSSGGMTFEGIASSKPMMLGGASAAQSPSLHVIDAFLGIEHHCGEKDFLQQQCNYMTKNHVDFIEWVREKRKAIGEFSYGEEYLQAVQALKKFRISHFNLARIFIHDQIKKQSPVTGTGGSDFLNLLRNIEKDC